MPAHRPQLDSIRFFAFFGVFLFHAYRERFAYGEFGVFLFFALSGFLITRILVKHETGRLGHDLRVFYLRRTLRIFPLYYGVLFVLLFFTNKLNDYDTGESVAWWYFLYLHNVYSFVFEVSTGPTTHFWSLCVEEQFYVLFPLALLLAPKRHRFALLVSLIVASIATRIALDALLPARKVGAGALLPVAGEYLLWGALFGLIDVRLRARPVPTTVLFVLGVVLHGSAVIDQLNFRLLASTGLEHAYQTLHGIGFSLIVFSLWRMPDNRLVRLLSVEPLVYLGRISYGLYVYHNFLYGTKNALLGPLPWLAPVPEVAVALAATILLAVLSWHLFEAPINGLKDRIPYGKAENRPAPLIGADLASPDRRTSPNSPGRATESPSPA